MAGKPKQIKLETPNVLPVGELRTILKKRNEFEISCQKCEKHRANDVHHLDGHHHNSEPANLVAWCKRCHNEHHGISDQITDLVLAARQLDNIKRQRIAMNNRLEAYKGLHYEAPMAHTIYESFKRLEKEATTVVIGMLKQEPVYTRYLEQIKGIGPLVSAVLISEIGSVERFETISALWAYSGFAVFDGQVQKRTKGQTANWNAKIRSCCLGVMVPNFVRLKAHADCFGRVLYDRYKAFYTGRDGGKLSKGHIDNRAKRKVAKIFLSSLWTAWRMLDNLPVSEPWIARDEQHTHMIKPFDWAPEFAV